MEVSTTLYGVAIGLSVPATVLIYLFSKPEKFEHWAALLYKAATRVACALGWCMVAFDRRAVAYGIQNDINGACATLPNCDDILPHAVRIEWTAQESAEAFIKKGQVVVRLRQSTDQDKNVLASAIMYVKAGMLPRARHYLDGRLRAGCEVRLLTSMLASSGHGGAFSRFLDTELPRLRASLPGIESDIQMLEEVDSAGLFTRVFLAEVRQAGDRLLGTLPTPATQDELRKWAEFLRTIATKGRDEVAPLAFNGARVKAAVVLVARKETIDTYGVRPYVDRVHRMLKQGYESVYVVAWGVNVLKGISGIRQQMDRTLVVEKSYVPTYVVHGTTEASMLVLRSNLSFYAANREMEEQVRQAVADVVPQVRDGDVEIAAIARMRGVGWKIAVRWAGGGDRQSALLACLGEDNCHIAALKTAFTGEFAAVIPWCEDAQDYICSALYPLPRDAVRCVQLDSENLVAQVRVNSREAVAAALGRKGANAALASELTGWTIMVKADAGEPQLSSPEDEFRAAIMSEVTELRNGDIEMVRVARVAGVGTRAVVRWAAKNGDRRRASAVCQGDGMCHMNAVRQALNNEWVYIHDWTDERDGLLMSALYPLRRDDIISVEFDEPSNTAVVTVRSVQRSPAMWRSTYNLVLAERIVGWRITIAEEP